MKKNLVVVIYDSVLNSVFDGQVLAPLVKKLHNGRYNHAYIVSFESQHISTKKLAQISNAHPQLRVIVVHRWKFVAPWLLYGQIRRLKKILTHVQTPYEILARGALAGFLAAKALEKTSHTSLTIQARGLLAKEYRYEHAHVSGYDALFHRWRAQQYEHIERAVYSNMQNLTNYTIESVSAALEEYLINTFAAKPGNFTRAKDDIPTITNSEKISEWRTTTRAELGLDTTKTVYCFSGAVKSWQDPHLVIDYFVKRYQENLKNFLLVLTPQAEEFKKQLQQKLPQSAYFVAAVAHEQVYQYLAAADIGLIFREPGVVSWVSRPVKAMEYEAMGLKIVHNNTVDWLLQRYGINRTFTT